MHVWIIRNNSLVLYTRYTLPRQWGSMTSNTYTWNVMKSHEKKDATFFNKVSYFCKRFCKKVSANNNNFLFWNLRSALSTISEMPTKICISREKCDGHWQASYTITKIYITSILKRKHVQKAKKSHNFI